MFCKNCGHQIGHGKKFCKNCGVAISDKTSSISTSHVNKNRRFIIETPSIETSKAWLIVGGAAVVVVAYFFFSGSLDKNTNGGISSSNEAAVVDINCDNGEGGSGTIFTSDGTVLTNNHVIAGATSCKITIPNPSTGQINEIYEATPVIIPKLSKEYDIATLKIDGAYTDTDGKAWGAYPTTFKPFTIPSSCDTTQSSKLGDPVRIYGYPVTSGGYNLTITDGIISSFSDGGYILTSAKVDSGNSGGLAVDQNGCWLGIPSAVESGNYQNLGVIIPGSVVAANFIGSVPAKASPPGLKSPEIATVADTAATPSDDQICQNSYGAHSEWSGSHDSSGNPTCGCRAGFSWDFSGNECASNTSLQSQCQTNYGTGSYSYVQSGQSYCGCSTGYEWNTDQTACIKVPTLTGYQVCSGLGANETWDGTYSSNGKFNCVCDSGYSWDSASQSCISGYTYCQNLNGYGATYDAATNSCSCESGYVYSGGQCESGLTYCQNTEGYGATYDSASRSCECQSGYIYDGYQCETASLYCSSKYGVGAEYNYSTKQCACNYGYYFNGSQCVFSGY